MGSESWIALAGALGAFAVATGAVLLLARFAKRAGATHAIGSILGWAAVAAGGLLMLAAFVR